MPGYGIVIKLKDLTQGKSFYRDLLQLGNPVMESNFWVEFELDGGFSLMLCALDPEEELPPESGRFSWILFREDPEACIAHLKVFGYEPESRSCKMGYDVIDFRDPEGNPFSIYSPLSPEENNTVE